jgi:hypothetical protein
MRLLQFLAVCLVSLAAVSCGWVELTAEGEKVRVLTASEVAKCQRLGKTTASVTEKVAGVRRHDEQILSELTIIARNAAINLDGDTVVAVGEEKDGKQVFDVYRCVPR